MYRLSAAVFLSLSRTKRAEPEPGADARVFVERSVELDATRHFRAETERNPIGARNK